MNDLERKRQLAFLSTFDRKFQGFRREMERLRRAAETGKAVGGKWPTDGLERTAKSLIGAGAVYGLADVADWAREFMWKVDQIRQVETPPSEEDMAELTDRIAALETLTNAARQTAGEGVTESGGTSGLVSGKGSPFDKKTPVSPKKAAKPGDATTKVLICVRDANIRKKITFIIRGARYGAVELAEPGALLEKVQSEAPELMIVDLDDKAPWGNAITEQLTLDSLADCIPVLKIATSPGAERWDILAKPVDSKLVLAKCKELLAATGHATRVQLGLRDPNLQELLDFVTSELKTGIIDAVRGENALDRFRLINEGRIIQEVWSLISVLRQSAAYGSRGRIKFAPAASGNTAMLALSEGEDVLGEDELRKEDLEAISGMRAVVADGDAEVRVLFERVLKDVGVRVRSAMDGLEALEAIQAGAPDLVVADIVMPDMDGWELAARLKMDYGLKEVPVIMLSWKDAFLQRVRAEGGIHSFQVTDNDRTQVLGAILRSIRPRLALARKLGAPGNVIGRIERIGVISVLKDVLVHRPDCQVHFRESWNDYEVSVREGKLLAVTMTGTDGSFASGPRALERLVGIENGRFDVRPAAGPARAQFKDDSKVLVNQTCARLNRMVDQVRDGALLAIEQVHIDEDIYERYQGIVPEKLKPALALLKEGKSPKYVVADQDLSHDSVETLLLELVRMGVATGFAAPEPRESRAPIARDTMEWAALDGNELAAAMTGAFMKKSAVVAKGVSAAAPMGAMAGSSSSSDEREKDGPDEAQSAKSEKPESKPAVMAIPIAKTVVGETPTRPPDAPQEPPVQPESAVAPIGAMAGSSSSSDEREYEDPDVARSAKSDTMPVETLDIEEVVPLPDSDPSDFMAPLRTSLPPAILPSLPPAVIKERKANKTLRFLLVLMFLLLGAAGAYIFQESLGLEPVFAKWLGGDGSASASGEATAGSSNSIIENEGPAEARSAKADEGPAEAQIAKSDESASAHVEEPASPAVATAGSASETGEKPVAKPVAKPTPKPEKKKEPAYGKVEVLEPAGMDRDIFILVDGRKRGKVPRTLRLPPGLHEIKFVRGGKKTIRMVSVKEGVTKEVTPRF